MEDFALSADGSDILDIRPLSAVPWEHIRSSPFEALLRTSERARDWASMTGVDNDHN